MIKYARLAVTTLLIILSITLLAEDTQIVSAQASERPILLVYNDSAPNKFGRYLGEILRAEGLNSFNMASLGSLGASTLIPYKVVILAETALSAAQAGYFTSYVNGGGHLIAMRPDAQIKNLFGLGTASVPLADGYMKMPDSGSSAGLSTESLQIHGVADQYTGSTGTKIADLYSNASTDTTLPAVISGTSGRAVAFLYDLAKNVVYTRQGNPANANPNLIDVDGDGVLRTIDLFQTLGGGDPWVNLDKVPIPQADEQQRLFARLVKEAIEQSYPMPQLWYFPGTAKTMLISTGDAHANPSEWYQTTVDVLNTYNAKMTFYVSIGGGLNDGNLQSWRSQGHEFGIHPPWYHPDTYEPYNIESLTQGYQVYNTWFPGVFTSPKSRTVRNHQVTWLGWTDAAELAVSYGLGMDTNFYTWGGWLQKSDNSWAHGYVNGSGQPMKFIKADGTILPYYQQVTTLIDEQLVNGAGAGSQYEQLSIDAATVVSRQLIDASLAGDYAALMTQFHVDYINAASDWVANTLAYAASKNIPMWNADRWLNFTETRYGASYNNIAWDNGSKTLSFSMAAANQPSLNLTTMIPLSYGGEPLDSVIVDNIWIPYTVQTIKGIDVAFASVPAGNHNFIVRYGTSPEPPPALPNAAPTRHYQTSLTADFTWSAVSWAEQYQVQVATNNTFTPPLSLLLLPNDGIVSASASSLSITLPQEGTYYWRVRAKHPQLGWRGWSAIQQLTADLP